MEINITPAEMAINKLKKSFGGMEKFDDCDFYIGVLVGYAEAKLKEDARLINGNIKSVD